MKLYYFINIDTINKNSYEAISAWQKSLKKILGRGNFVCLYSHGSSTDMVKHEINQMKLLSSDSLKKLSVVSLPKNIDKDRALDLEITTRMKKLDTHDEALTIHNNKDNWIIVVADTDPTLCDKFEKTGCHGIVINHLSTSLRKIEGLSDIHSASDSRKLAKKQADKIDGIRKQTNPLIKLSIMNSEKKAIKQAKELKRIQDEQEKVEKEKEEEYNKSEMAKKKEIEERVNQWNEDVARKRKDREEREKARKQAYYEKMPDIIFKKINNDGTKTIEYKDGTIKELNTDGSIDTYSADGSRSTEWRDFEIQLLYGDIKVKLGEDIWNFNEDYEYGPTIIPESKEEDNELSSSSEQSVGYSSTASSNNELSDSEKFESFSDQEEELDKVESPEVKLIRSTRNN